jgi:hypothetical protein
MKRIAVLWISLCFAVAAQNTTPVGDQCIERKRWYDDRLTFSLYGSGSTLLGESGKNFGLAFQTNAQAAFKVREFRYFALSGYADLSYVQIGKARDAELSNILEVYSGIAGAQLSRELPRKFSVYLNLAAGLSYSLLTRGQDNAYFNSRNLILNPSAEVRYQIRHGLSAGVRIGYSQILYAGSDFRAFQAGLGVAYAL